MQQKQGNLKESESISKFRATVAYIGSNYCGFQTQDNGVSVQYSIEQALATFFGQPTRILGASRTDSGVHALGQTIVFTATDKAYHSHKWQYSLNSLLPPDIRIGFIAPVEAEFHPIYGAKSKIYCYRFWKSRCSLPFIDPYVFSAKPWLAIDPMQKGLQYFIGTHDFSAFCAHDSAAKTKIRTIHDARLCDKDPYFELWFLGSGFLKQMIRIIVGTLFDVGIGKIAPDQIPQIIASKDRKCAGQTAPAKGLMLHKIFYDEEIRSLDMTLNGMGNGFNLDIH